MKLSLPLISATVLASGLTALTLASAPASASTTSKLLACSGSSKGKVENCCQKIITRHNDPFWFRNAGGSCAAVIKCSTKTVSVGITYAGTKKVVVCAVVIPGEGGGRGKLKVPDRKKESRDPGGRAGGPNSPTHG
ncbi:MAG: hypothetical protein LCH46_11040 [Proteobacteria bacterium]|nr:hypothetical protein [Pseudomonadota bacterium]